MPYLLIEDFKLGVDLRKSPTGSPAGSARVLRNGFITAGGEIEKRPALTHIGDLPPGETHGLAFQGSNLVVFGVDDYSPTLPSFVQYKRLICTTSPGAQITRILDVQNYGAKTYVVAEMSDGYARHFFDGEEVTTASGTNARAHRRKMYAVDGANIRFSEISNPALWDGDTGSGIIDVSEEDATSTDLVGLERYYSYLAVMARTFIQIWSMDPDPAANQLLQTLHNIGLVAPNAASGYGNGDVLFLSDTGIRSIRARDSSNAAVLNDLGSPVDAYVAAKRNDLTPETAQKIKAVVDPLTGHFWLVWGSEALVLAMYPNSKVSAWSMFDLGAEVDDVVVANSRLVVRQGDSLSVYGYADPANGNPFDPNTPLGAAADRYDASEVTVVMPFLDASRPATTKRWNSIDVAAKGVWAVSVCPDYRTPDVWTRIGTITADTWDVGRIPVDVSSTHLAVKLESLGDGEAKLTSVALHFEGGEES